MALPSGLRALGQRDYRVYYIGTLIGQTGTWMQTVTQSWLVLQITSSPFKLGLISTLQFGPILLFSVFTGVLADRVNKRALLIVTQATQAGLAIVLGTLVWHGHVQYWQVAVMAILWGVMASIDQPARQSFVIELVGREHVTSAVGLNSAAFNGARIIGPAVAGLLIARAGLSPGFFLNAIAFGFAIALLTQIPGRRPSPRGVATFVEDMTEGLAYALKTPAIRFILGLQVICSFCIFNFSVYVPLLAKNVLGLGAEGFGLLMTCLGIGALTAGLSLGALSGGGTPRPRMIAIALVVALAGLIGLGFARWFWVAAGLLALTGFTGTVVVAGCNTSLQLSTPDALRGRVMSLYTLLSGGVFPIGAFVVGSISEHWGVPAAFRFNGATGLLALTALSLLRARTLRRAARER